MANNDSSNSLFDQISRVGAFEVSYKGQLIFSKLLSSKWPNINLVSGRCEKIVEAMRRGIDHKAYLANALQGERGVAAQGGNRPQNSKKKERFVSAERSVISSGHPVYEEKKFEVIGKGDGPEEAVAEEKELDSADLKAEKET